jgi:hypothetical protein
MAHACNLSYPEKPRLLEGSWFQANLGKKFVRPHLSGKKLGMVVNSCHPSDREKCKIGSWFRQDPTSKPLV